MRVRIYWPVFVLSLVTSSFAQQTIYFKNVT